MKKIIAFVLAVFLACPAQAGPDVVLVTTAFQEAAYGIRTDEGKIAQQVIRWYSPIRVYFSNQFTRQTRDLGLSRLRNLAAEAGVRIEVVNTAQEANFYVALKDTGYCRTHASWDDNFAMTKVTIEVNVNLSGGTRCWDHEILHSLGLLGHPTTKDSALASNGAQQATQLDRTMLRLLYRR